MKTRSTGRTAASIPRLLLGLAVLTTSCARADRSPMSRAEVTRESRWAQGEVWNAHTVVARENGAVTIDERATLDGEGRLVFAETRARDGADVLRVIYDRGAGIVTLERGTGATDLAGTPVASSQRRFHADAREPWVYGAVVMPAGDPMATPLGAWIAARAAKNARTVRLVAAERETSFSVPSDQVLVEAARGAATVIVGDDGVDVDDRFVQTVHLHAFHTAFERDDSAPAGTFVFKAAACSIALDRPC